MEAVALSYCHCKNLFWITSQKMCGSFQCQIAAERLKTNQQTVRNLAHDLKPQFNLHQHNVTDFRRGTCYLQDYKNLKSETSTRRGLQSRKHPSATEKNPLDSNFRLAKFIFQLYCTCFYRTPKNTALVLKYTLKARFTDLALHYTWSHLFWRWRSHQ